MLKKSVLTACLLLFFTTVCFAKEQMLPPLPQYNYNSPALEESRIALAGLEPFDRFEQVEQVMGKAEEVSETTQQNGYQVDTLTMWSYRSKGLLVVFSNGKVAQLITGGPCTLKTPDGIGIGSTSAEVLKVYGNIPFMEDSVTNPGITEYLYRSDNNGTVRLLTLVVAEGTVQQITISHW